jgi:hypothetical protein
MKSPNPLGRPKLGRRIADILNAELDEIIGKKSLRKEIAARAIYALRTGFVEFPGKNGKLRSLKMSAKEWTDLFKFVAVHLDGPAKLELEMSHGQTLIDSPFYLPADVIAPSFTDVYRDIVRHSHTEYVMFGGRGSTKSSFISLAIIYLIKNKEKKISTHWPRVKLQRPCGTQYTLSWSGQLRSWDCRMSSKQPPRHWKLNTCPRDRKSISGAQMTQGK